jgi:hypothetical protein
LECIKTGFLKASKTSEKIFNLLDLKNINNNFDRISTAGTTFADA